VINDPGSHTPMQAEMTYHWLREAMDWYEKAQALKPAENDESILRWNTCARLLESHKDLRPKDDGPVDPSME
jgi:hypothetical protein